MGRHKSLAFKLSIPGFSISARSYQQNSEVGASIWNDIWRCV